MRSAIAAEETTWKTARLLHNSSRFCICICDCRAFILCTRKLENNFWCGSKQQWWWVYFIIILLLFCCVQKYILCASGMAFFPGAWLALFSLLFSHFSTCNFGLLSSGIQKGGIAIAILLFFFFRCTQNKITIYREFCVFCLWSEWSA